MVVGNRSDLVRSGFLFFTEIKRFKRFKDLKIQKFKDSIT